MITACRDAVPLMSDYLDGLLGVPMHTAFEGHLTICPRCREMLRALELVPPLVRRSTEVDPPADLPDRVLDRIRRR